MELFIKGKRAIEDAYLKQHVRKLVERFYLLHGLDMRDIERRTMRELVELLEQFLDVQGKQLESLQNELKTKDEYILDSDKEKSALAMENQKLEKRNISLYVRNEQLIRDVAELELENTNVSQALKAYETVEARKENKELKEHQELDAWVHEIKGGSEATKNSVNISAFKKSVEAELAESESLHL